jgi:hypothetical protein
MISFLFFAAVPAPASGAGGDPMLKTAAKTPAKT